MVAPSIYMSNSPRFKFRLDRRMNDDFNNCFKYTLKTRCHWTRS